MTVRSRQPFRSLPVSAGLAFVIASHTVAATLDTQSQGASNAHIPTAELISEAVLEASRRFGVPQLWIRAVMRVESGGVVRAVSSAGAIGLMQVMPQTYAELRWRYGLGADPFVVRDNVLAGTAYIRELADRYGAPDFLAAYNAGPARFEDALSGVRPLPPETIDYLARLGPIVGESAATWRRKQAPEIPRSPLEAPLFVALRVHSPKAEMPFSGGVENDRKQQDGAVNNAVVDGAEAKPELDGDKLAPSSKGLTAIFPGHSDPAR